MISKVYANLARQNFTGIRKIFVSLSIPTAGLTISMMETVSLVILALGFLEGTCLPGIED
jgi:hypothetical protein